MKCVFKVGLSAVLFTAFLFTSACGNDSGKGPSVSPSSSAKPSSVMSGDSKAVTAPPSAVQNNGPRLSEVLSKSKGIKNYYYEYYFRTRENFNTYKMWIKDTKMKLDSDGMIIFIDYAKNEAYTTWSNDMSKATKAGLPNLNNESNPFSMVTAVIGEPNLDKYKFIRKEDVDGKKCLVFSSDTISPKWTFYVWEDKGIILKGTVHSSSDDSVSTTIEFKKFEIGKVTDDMVTLPKNTQITTLN
ncbi:MAG: hypothetical protein N2645_10355 [Clostridia bacterium]|nr:hypothetical protein [Clostridia bacterium]